MSQAGASVDTSQLAPGDLVFFNTLRRTFPHVGIYRQRQFVHARTSGGGVRIEHLASSTGPSASTARAAWSPKASGSTGLRVRPAALRRPPRWLRRLQPSARPPSSPR
jgi:cell wall-associated NlpC family hydrolase